MQSILDSQELYNSFEIAVNAALNAGEEVIKIYAQDFHEEIKDDGTPITIADKKANSCILDNLKKTKLPVVSEESRIADYNERKNWDYYWLIDPIDGTKEFINKNGEFTINIALMKKDSPIAGIIFVPAINQLYFGVDNAGSYSIEIDNKNISYLSLQKLLSTSKKLTTPESPTNIYNIAVSRSHLNNRTKSFIEKIKTKSTQINLIETGSSLKFCRLCEGICNIYPRYGKTFEWDIAAGHAILAANGGELYDVNTLKPLKYNKTEMLNPYFMAFSNKETAEYFFNEFL
ncbi:MAG: 3'(2'),5'-bisphosphate nucleotidase CysQ [Bacteroidota bacterium]